MAESTSNECCGPSGQDEDFVEPVDEDLQCPICHLPLKEPVLTRCGHRYCKECLDEHIRRSPLRPKESYNFTCPTDWQHLNAKEDVFPDKATERKILSLAIKCPSDGCKWTGELRNKEVHLGNCPFHRLPCNNSKCQERVQRRHIKQHENEECPWRILNCSYCSDPYPECEMQDHIKECKKFPMTCPNSCGSSIPRDEVSTHTKDECPRTILPCPFARVGCTQKSDSPGSGADPGFFREESVLLTPNITDVRDLKHQDTRCLVFVPSEPCTSRSSTPSSSHPKTSKQSNAMHWTEEHGTLLCRE
ncbi:TNF receptor-associated factor 4-like [Stylophora pistillata]|uniref:TNF receptor-associated factor 4-like n=1 Tax=Stylophora pistillata TaxID=50429 RepID=UPI000C03FC43|nr:TNF receptor-associated factor 4-like [Stylophora pistillata]